MTGPAVHFENVSLQLGGSPILSDINFTVAAGALHCIVGPNGGGKSSLIKCLLGQMPHKGTIRLDGAQGPIGYVPQALEFDRNLPMTVQDVMSLMRQSKPSFLGVSRKYQDAISAALAKTGVAERRLSPFGGLSGGERQRVLFAQALDPMPQLLVLDEPMAGLDDTGGRLIEDLVLEFHAQGVTVIWISHDWPQVRRLATAVTGISRTILFNGPPAEALPATTGALQS
ncbi:MAG: metal ABC transporter ATP-binding protein [Caulobacteraceae bacterium]